MPVIQKEDAVLTTASLANALSGSAFEFLRGNAVVSMGVAASAAGGFVTIQSGSDIILEESPPLVKATMPTIPDDMYYNDVGVAGDRLVIRYRNPTGGTITFRSITQITPL